MTPSLREGVQYMVAATSLARRFVGIPHYHQVYGTSCIVSHLEGLKIPIGIRVSEFLLDTGAYHYVVVAHSLPMLL